MPVLKLHAENIGPFEKLELDLTHPDGSAHLGPHILAGVNGSGKTTVLRTIAWCLDSTDSGFDRDSWAEFSRGRGNPSASVQTGTSLGQSRSLVRWPRSGAKAALGEPGNELGCVATYAPHPALRWMERPPIGLREDARKNWLSFKGSVTNEDVQAFWVASFSRESLLKTRGRENGQATETVQRLRDTIRAILGPELEPDVNIDATFPQPVLRFRGKDLNFSQLAAGFNSTLAWITDYLLRQELFDWGDGQRAKDRPGVILIDEIETHLHPQWQRRILNGIRTAFPTTQIIIATHSPFVVSSCKEARVHVFKVDDRGRAYLDRSIDDPDAVSVAATVQDVFEIASQFGPEIEGKLREWNELKKRDSVGRLSAREKTELKKRTRDLASRGEELALMVHETVLPEALLEELIEAASSKRR